MFTDELSTKILQISNERKLTLEKLADASGLSRKFISNITNRKQKPTLDSFEKICSALEVEPNDLLINEKSKTTEKSTAKAVNKIYCHIKNQVATYSAICPECNSILKSDWQSYCGHCGQRLSWEGYSKAEIVYRRPRKK